MRRVAVIGSGIAGLSAAHALSDAALSPQFQVTLFEAGAYFGGHAHTVDLTLGGVTHGVDTGFLVFNERTYPKLIRLFGELGIPTTGADMSFSVKAPAAGLEWSGRGLNTVFAQRRNLLRPAFLRMLGDVIRFNRLATALGASGNTEALDQTIGDFLGSHRFSREFREWYFLPMVGSIWSCPTRQMLLFPVATMIRFCHNHGLLQVANRPRWFTVTGGSREYIRKMLPRLTDARLNMPVRHVRRAPPGEGNAGVFVVTDLGTERFDEVVMACHSDQALALLGDATPQEKRVLGAIHYHRNRAILHTDTSVLPKRQRAWAAWNYERAEHDSQEHASVCLHYLINRLQPLPFQQSVIVSLNPVREPRAGTVHGEYDYEHPVFDAAAIAAQQELHAVQGVAHTWYCGAWTRYGFHEDGLASGLAVAGELRKRGASEDLVVAGVAA